MMPRAADAGTVGRPAATAAERAADGRASGAGRRRAGGWRDGVFLALACAGFAGAAHATGSPGELAARLQDGSILTLPPPETLVGVSVPLLLGLAASCGPLLIRIRWQSSVLALGIGWVGLVGLALLQERALGQSFEVLPCALGLAALAALAVLLGPARGSKAGPAQQQPAPADRPRAAAPA